MTDAFALAETLAKHGQSHLLEHAATLDPQCRAAFCARLAAIDWAELAHPCEPPPIQAVGKSRVIGWEERQARAAELVPRGEAAYRAGEVAVLMVAGGQGTRLGSSAPKGCFSVAPHSGKSIYQLQAEKVWALSQRSGRSVPFLIMTSPATDAETRQFFAAHADFGLAPGQVRFFCQGTVPSLSLDGKALLAGPGQLLENPDGHGGCHTALVASGELARLIREGIRYLVYIQVDNILAPVDDPLLVGLTAAEGADVVTKVLEKAHPDEKLGHLVRVGERDRIVEYTELTPEQTRLTWPDGELIYRWGSPALHCWSVAFLARLAERGFKLPLHRSKKPLKSWPEPCTGWKNERFIFDLVPEAERSLGLVIDRREEFAPIKNKDGEDSPATAVRMASDLYARWLTKAGVRVALPPGALIEISPRFAATEAQFLARWDGRVRELSGPWYLEA
ncbi:MAG: UTP--glucose-1-phosphate uridylyltransferase [Planctomycetota bacterium]|nr:UTP--glucose-1-phosphate uridylyltransferase [Planctomycetota bacterium]MCX8039105.1 UTP--glucose-1-phosphate uridylyltransferase [Planctomycetota bacterium]MDW8373699.1 UTP--glucose-1-phosphate uridylyltransferase [Planctomycetota bacterium]